MDFRSPLLPSTFCTHDNLEEQQRSCSLVRRWLRASGPRRLLCLSVDETTWRPTFDAVRGLRHDGISIIGAGWHPEESLHVLGKDDTRCESDLARLSISIVASRIDTNHLTVDMNLVPMLQSTTKSGCKSEHVMELTGQVMHSFAASGPPPLCISYDNGGANVALNQALLGLLSVEQLGEFTFFKKCSLHVIPLKFFPFACLRTGVDFG